MNGQAGSDTALDELRARLAEATEALQAIRQGEVDALVIEVGGSDQVYTLHTVDEPYRALIEQMQEGAVVLSASHDVLYCNSRFADLVGSPIETVIGACIDRFVCAPDRGAFHDLLNTGSGRLRSRMGSPDGPPVEVYLSLTSTVTAGVDRRNLIVTDLRELNEAHSDRDRAELDSRMKDEFQAMLAHELRNPLSAVKGAAQVLKTLHTGGQREQRARNVIERQVHHLARLIDDLLDAQRMASGKIQLNLGPLDLAGSVRLAVGSVTSDAGLDRHVIITTEPVWVDGDAVRLEQVLTNLLTNAVRHTPAGSRILVTLRGDGSHALLTVEDTGTGIPARLLPNIFDMFVQGGRTVDRGLGGLGIGLTLVRRLVELHGGTVVASSAGEGLGSTFTVRLPQIPAPDRSAGVSAPPGSEESRRVLLIEDNNDAREMLRMMLELEGHVVCDAADGAGGLSLLETECPDVAIIDIGLPGLDGYEVARRIRGHSSGRDTLLVALTGYGRPDDYRQSIEAGFDHHLVKPIDPDELRRLLRESVRPR